MKSTPTPSPATESATESASESTPRAAAKADSKAGSSDKSTAKAARPAKLRKSPKASKATVSGKEDKRKRSHPTGQTMRVPEPTNEILLTGELPDVRRASAALARQEEARGHLQPSGVLESSSPEPEGPLDASLIVSALAVDVHPKMEDTYDYSVVDDLRGSRWCPRPTRMVNTGCGAGEVAVYFAKLGYQCVGIDSDRSAVGLARERAWLAGVEIDFMVGDLFETPNLLPAESFGLAVDRGAFYRLTDLRDRQRYLRNILRLLFQGGILYLSTGFFPLEDAPRKSSRSRRGESKILLAHEGGVVVNELRRAGFDLLHRALRQTTDSGEFGELLLTLRKH